MNKLEILESQEIQALGQLLRERNHMLHDIVMLGETIEHMMKYLKRMPIDGRILNTLQGIIRSHGIKELDLDVQPPSKVTLQ